MKELALSTASRFDALDQISDLLIKEFDQEKLNQYAFFVLGKMENRDEQYIYRPYDYIAKVNNNYLFNFRNMGLDLKAHLIVIAENYETAFFQLDSIFFCIIFFLFVIDGVLIYSIMLNDIEERTYEFAMLRTLGYENSNLAVLLVI